MPAAMPADRFERIGNNLSADFANTVYAPDHPDGSLRSAKDVVDFLLVTGALSPADAASVRRRVADGAAAAGFLALALRLRAAVTEALTAIEQQRSLHADALACLNEILEADAGFARLLHRRGTAYELTYHRVRDDLAALLVPVARETARLLATPGVPVRHCAGVGCVRHFYDDSRTRRRRWCDMAICGNRAKMSAFTQRHKARE